MCKKSLASRGASLLLFFLALRGVASMAQSVEHRSRKAGVIGSNPIAGSIASRKAVARKSSSLFAFKVPFRPSPRVKAPNKVRFDPRAAFAGARQKAILPNEFRGA